MVIIITAFPYTQSVCAELRSNSISDSIEQYCSQLIPITIHTHTHIMLWHQILFAWVTHSHDYMWIFEFNVIIVLPSFNTISIPVLYIEFSPGIFHISCPTSQLPHRQDHIIVVRVKKHISENCFKPESVFHSHWPSINPFPFRSCRLTRRSLFVCAAYQLIIIVAGYSR